LDALTVVIVACGIAAGMIAGLLPGLPAWIVPMLIMPVMPELQPQHVVVFWLVTMIGSQFFGSVASIQFQIPGEQSSMVYLDDIRSSSPQQRSDLIRHTADASIMATLLALALITLGQDLFLSALPWLGTTVVTFVILVVMSVIAVISTGTVAVSAVLFVMGVALAPKSNIDLPSVFLIMNQYTYDLSVISLLIGLMILPRLLWRPSAQHQISGRSLPAIEGSWYRYGFMGTGVGMLIGLLPGATATMSSVLAYRHTPGTVWQRIVSAEAANNSAIIIGAFLLIYLQLPLNLDSMVISHVFNTQGWDFARDFVDPGRLPFTLVTVAVSSLMIWILARQSRSVFAAISSRIDNRFFVSTIILIMLTVDLVISYNSYDLSAYLTWLIAISAVGMLCERRRWAVFPAVLGYVLGDQLIWSAWQMIGRL